MKKKTGQLADCVAICSCGKSYDSEKWELLQWIGDVDDGDGGLLELRNCFCGSTIARGK